MRPAETPPRPDSATSAGDRVPADFGALPETGRRKPYRRPRLISYGRLADVTRMGGSEVNDSGTSGSLGQNPALP